MTEESTDRPDRARLDTTPTAAPPPSGSAIVVERTPGGTRITLPRLYTRSDLMVAGLAGAVAVWMAAWLDAMAGRFPAPSTLGMALLGAIGLVFGLVAVYLSLDIVARRVIEDRGAHIVLGRQLGARRFSGEAVPKSAITLVDRGWAVGEGPGAPAAVRIWTDEGVHRVGRHLDADALAWLEGAVRAWVGRE